MTSRTLSAIGLAIGLALSTAVAASTPNDVRDLVGARASSGESALQSRGYVHIETSKFDDRSYGQWWSPARQTCLSVATFNGRYDSITQAPAVDCNQQPRQGGDDDSGASAAVVAVGVAAVIGALAVAHKSHHHDDDKHHDDGHHEDQFERGYRDGLYHHNYANHDNTEAYGKGYRAGVEQRDHDTSYRHHSGKHDRGYRKVPAYEFKNLAGRKREPANDQMRELGFRDVDDFKQGNTRYRIWYNRATGQCVQGTYADDRVVSMNNIRTHAACR